jgi:hypothetical protein
MQPNVDGLELVLGRHPPLDGGEAGVDRGEHVAERRFLVHGV